MQRWETEREENLLSKEPDPPSKGSFSAEVSRAQNGGQAVPLRAKEEEKWDAYLVPRQGASSEV